MKTKTTLLILLALLFISPVMHSQKSVSQLFNNFSKEKGVVRVDVGKLTMAFASLFTDAMGVKEVEVLSFDDCNESVKEKLNHAIASLKDDNYETMISVNEGKERTKVLVKLKDESIREIIVLTTGEDPAIIRIKGKIKLSDFEKVMKKNKSDK
jgi:DNA repair exonuclease SbcCD nuclease subunit